MEWQRVAAVTGAGGPGSGYLVGPSLVLTSAHMTGPVDRAVEVFRPGRPRQFTGRVVWAGKPGGRDDAALVQIDDPAWTPATGRPVMWGRTVTYLPGLACQCWGVPELVQRPDEPVEVAQLAGKINPGDRLVGDRYVVHLDSYPPSSREDGGSPWGGLSGAAVCCGDVLAGVIVADPAGYQHAALEAVPVSLLLRNREVVAALATHAGLDNVQCEAIELYDLADTPPAALEGGAVPSPAGLLPARRAVVPFRGREDLLGELRAWAEAPGVGVRLLHGGGGQGKTRLAHEFGQRLARRDGWAVVWLNPATGAEKLGVLAHTVVPVLVVVDYADARTDQLTAVVDVLARRRETERVKVLLLARTAGAWWQDWAATGDAVRDVVETTVVRDVPVLDATTQARTDTYRAAVGAFAARLRAVAGLPDVPWPQIADVVIGQPPSASVGGDMSVLAVQMTALADLLDAGQAPSNRLPGGGGVRGPEDRVLDHERGYWLATARAQGLMPGIGLPTLTDAVAAASLLKPAADRWDTVAARIPGIADQPYDRQEAIRFWLAQLYPPALDGALEGVQPDRLAERLIGRLILDRDRTCVVEALAPTVDKREAALLLTVCVRAAAHAALGAAVGDAVTKWCVRYADTLVVPAIQVATMVEAPGPLVRALDQITHDVHADTQDLVRLWDALPEHSQTWAESAVALAQAVVARQRQAIATDSDVDGSQLAASLNNLSGRLGAVGRWRRPWLRSARRSGSFAVWQSSVLTLSCPT